MPTTNQIIAVAIIGLVATAIVVGAVVYYSLKIHGSGKILAIGVQVYRDAALTEPVSSIDWGTIPAGGYSQLTLYIRSNSTGPSTWSLAAQDWQPPEAENYMILTWDYDGSIVQPDETRTVNFNLAVSQNVTGIYTFEFNTVITATSISG